MAEPSPEPPKVAQPPVSAFTAPTQLLQQNPAILPPNRPGTLGILDRYEILTQIGQGGMGTVFKARDTTSGKLLAIKILRPELAAHGTALHRFTKEAQHMAHLKHPHILPVLAVGARSDVPYFAMPFLERGGLAKLINPATPLGAEQTFSVARQVAEALSYAHSKGIIHHDLKPANVLLDDKGNALLTDFGLARTVFNDSWLDITHALQEGTAPYLSPQLAEGQAEDTRCDIYAFGCLLYELLTGIAPYEGPSAQQILEQVRRGPPMPILRRRPEASRSLVQVAETAMARQHRDRYANMADVLADLKRIEAGKPPLGSHAALNFGRIWDRTSRRLAVAGCAAVALGVCLFGYKWLTAKPRLEVVRTVPVPQNLILNGSWMGDWDGDGDPDVFFSEKDLLQVVSSKGHQHRPVILEEPHTTGISPSMVADITGDGLEEAFVSWANGSNSFLAAINRMGWPVKKFSFGGSVGVHKYWGTNQTRLRAMSIVDLDRDGRLEILASVTSTWSKQPRGLCCFDLESTDLNWFFETAPFVTEIETIDLDGDGKLEIVMGSNSPGNGNELPDGTDDAHAYVYVVSAAGKELWHKPIGAAHSSVTPIAVPKSGATVLAWAWSIHEYNEEKEQAEQGEIIKFDAEGDRQHRYDAGIQLMSCLAADLDEDEQQEILATDRLGFLHVLDEELKLRRKVQLVTNRFPVVDLRVAGVVRFGADNKPMLLLTSWQVENRTGFFLGNRRDVPPVSFHHDNEVLIVDSKSQVVARHKVADERTRSSYLSARVLPTKDGDWPEILVLSDRMELLRLSRR